MHDVLAQELPETLGKFVSDACDLSTDAFRFVRPELVPEPAKRLLVHPRDMTSTLAAFHGSELRVEILQQRRLDDVYLREVFLRTQPGEHVVEYGVIAIALDQFTPPQQEVIRAGEIPLGAILHRFEIPFTSAPIGFFSIDAASLHPTPLGSLATSACFGRFNRLAKPTGEPLAWIMEILPPVAPS